MNIQRHQDEILLNQQYWQKKPILKKIYHDFHQKIAAQLSNLSEPLVVELGSGVGNIKEVIPDCLRTDLFPNPWLDQVENAYKLSFADVSLSDLILFDVFHHLHYPGNAFREFERVLRPGGKVIIFDPCMSLLGFLTFGLFHHEPVAWFSEITWNAPLNWSVEKTDYYAAQGNATRIFFGSEKTTILEKWDVAYRQRFSAISYIGSGGYSKPQMYPDSFYPALRLVEKILDLFPALFSTRCLVVLSKKSNRMP